MLNTTKVRFRAINKCAQRALAKRGEQVTIRRGRIADDGPQQGRQPLFFSIVFGFCCHGRHAKK